MKYAKKLSLVKCLDLSSNSFSGNIALNIRSLKGLIILNISRNHFSGEIPRSIREMTPLESLDLSQNNLSRTILTEIQLLTYLSKFNVSYNNLLGAIPQGGQMMTFSSSCFTNNSALCGLQIYVSCSSILLDSPKASKDSEDTKDYIWWDMGMATGFVVSFLIVMGILWVKEHAVSHASKSWMTLSSLYYKH